MLEVNAGLPVQSEVVPHTPQVRKVGVGRAADRRGGRNDFREWLIFILVAGGLEPCVTRRLPEVCWVYQPRSHL